MSSLKRNRLQLLLQKRKLALVKRGAKILTDKRDALLKEFRGMISDVRAARAEMEKNVDVAGKSLALSRSMESVESLESSAVAARRKIEFSVSEQKIWGVKVPSVEYESSKRGIFDRGSMPGYRHPIVEKTAARFEDVIDSLVKSAVVENRFTTIGGAIRKTSRRVNALEQRVGPEIEKEIVQISSYIEEMAREEVFRMKRFKALKVKKGGKSKVRTRQPS